MKRCEKCGRLVDDDKTVKIFGRVTCENCVPNVIYDYHHYPTNWRKLPLAYNPFLLRFPYMGVEIEIDEGGESDFNAIKISEAMGRNSAEVDDVIWSHDGSLDDGMEAISQIATYQHHAHSYGWRTMMTEARRLGYSAHNAGTCGLHVHVDREYFGPRNNETFLKTEKAFAILSNNNVEWIKQFSRRENWYYCAFYDTNGYRFRPDRLKDLSVRNMLDKMTECYASGSHGVAFCNKSRTLEFRFFRGTLNFDTFKASLQLVNMFTFACKHYSDRILCDLDLGWFKNFAAVNGYNEFLSEVSARCI